MSNRCYTKVAVFGEREELEELYSYLSNFEKCYHGHHPEYKEHGVYERDFAEAFGYIPVSDYDSCGWIVRYELQTDCLRVWQNDRNVPRTNCWYFITQLFRTLDYVYFAQEPYMGLFECTDDEHRFFDYKKFSVDVDMESDDYIWLRGSGNTEEELVADVNKNCSTDFKTIEDIFRYYLTIPYDAMFPDVMNTFFIHYTNPWLKEPDAFVTAYNKIRNEPGWTPPEPLYPHDEDDEDM